jgi:hypothetical protein
MVLSEQRFNVVDIEPLVEYYDSIGVYRSETMKKADPGKALLWIEPSLRKCFPFVKQFVGGNFYKHKSPYLPHTDHQQRWGLTSVNIVIPLSFNGTQPFLVVFDQKWKNDPKTWTMVYEKDEGKISSSTNTQLKGLPCQYEIEGKTGEDINETFCEQYLPLPNKCYYDLSGEAFPFTPGSAIIFDNSKIHCTSKFIGEKLGLSLRYTV